MDEVEKYKDSSKGKIKLMIFIYRFFRFFNSDFFYFTYSLATVLVPLFIFNFSVGVIIAGMILHYFLFMIFLKKIIDKWFKTETEINEIDEIIEILKSFLKNKNPN